MPVSHSDCCLYGPCLLQWENQSIMGDQSNTQLSCSKTKHTLITVKIHILYLTTYETFIQIPCLNEAETLPLVLKDIPHKIPGIDSIDVSSCIFPPSTTWSTYKIYSYVYVPVGVQYVLRLVRLLSVSYSVSANDQIYGYARVREMHNILLEPLNPVIMDTQKTRRLKYAVNTVLIEVIIWTQTKVRGFRPDGLELILRGLLEVLKCYGKSAA